MRESSPREVNNLNITLFQQKLGHQIYRITDFICQAPDLTLGIYPHLTYLKIQWNRCYYIPFTSKKLGSVPFRMSCYHDTGAGRECNTDRDGGPDFRRQTAAWSAREGLESSRREYSHSNSHHLRGGREGGIWAADFLTRALFIRLSNQPDLNNTNLLSFSLKSKIANLFNGEIGTILLIFLC